VRTLPKAVTDVCRVLAVIAFVVAWLVTLAGCLFADTLAGYFATVFFPPAAFVTAFLAGTWPFLIPVVVFGIPWLLGRRHAVEIPAASV
jgi:hypothetical protein